MTENTFIDANTQGLYTPKLQELETKLLQYCYLQLGIADGQPKDSSIDYLLKIKQVMLEIGEERGEGEGQLAQPIFMKMLGGAIDGFIANRIAPLFSGTNQSTLAEVEAETFARFVQSSQGRPQGEMDVPMFFNIISAQMKLGVTKFTPEHVVELFRSELMSDHERAGGVCGSCASEIKCTSASEAIGTAQTRVA